MGFSRAKTSTDRLEMMATMTKASDRSRAMSCEIAEAELDHLHADRRHRDAGTDICCETLAKLVARLMRGKSMSA